MKDNILNQRQCQIGKFMAVIYDQYRMKKVQGQKKIYPQDQKTKLKLNNLRIRAIEKETIATKYSKNNSDNGLVSILKQRSQIISEESSYQASSSNNQVIQIDPLSITGQINNLRPFNDDDCTKYKYSQGVIFEVDEYLIIFAGRHQVEFQNGLPVSLYIPPFFKSPKNPVNKKIQVLIQRKLRPQLSDPLQYPYVIVDPLNSLYPTYICSWIQCKRKITLEHYIQYNEPINEYFVLGNSIHRYLQWLIRKQVTSDIPTQKQIRQLYDSFLYQMYILDLHFDLFAQKIEEGIVNLVNWYDNHVVKGKVIQLNKWEKKYLKIVKTFGSEVMVKSNYFGIRGKVDGVFEGQFRDEKLNKTFNVVVPFELKTGKKVLDSHKKQIDFYNFLLRQNKKMGVIGLLYYSQSNILQHRLQNPLACFENINVHRNKIILNILNLYSEKSKLILPPLPNTYDQCRLCDVTIECAVTRLEQNNIKDIQDISQVVDDSPQKYQVQIFKKLKGMSVLEFSYLKKWTLMLHLEQVAEKKQNREILKKSQFNKVKLGLGQLTKFQSLEKGQTLQFKLTKFITSHEMSDELETYFKIGEKMRIFIPMLRLADCCRIVSTKKTTKIFQIQVDIKNESVKFNDKKCSFLLEDQEIQYIDVELQLYENSFYNYTRGYCYKFIAEAEKWLKQIVVEETYEEKNSLLLPVIENQDIKEMNTDQIQAFRKCVEAERLCLVEGMPGTGKTQLILKLIQYFYRQGKTVLVTSFTNQALVNILDREINNEKKIPKQQMIREGSRYAISGSLESLSSQSQIFQNIEDYKGYFKKKKIWFVTISSLYIQHLPKKFDVVIVDEASQCLQANCLEALLKGKKFILVGDEKQLQPVVKSKQAIDKGMQVSLFERLCNIYQNHRAVLKKQYRMSPQIMNLTNNLVYNGVLELALPSMKSRQLDIPKNWSQLVRPSLRNIIDPAKSVRFINYDSALNLFKESDQVDIRRVKRLLQIQITLCLYKQFLSLGVKKQNILVISAYNSLVHQLIAAFKKQNLIENSKSQILTIDKSQGTDKEIIIFIFHKGNKELIQNYRRLNVALTRARNKFIIVGSHKELKELATWTGKLALLLQPNQIDLDRQMIEFLLEI